MFDGYKTTCPYCKAKNALIVLEFTDVLNRKHYPNTPLYKDGFDARLSEQFVDRNGGDTDDEILECQECHKHFLLQEVMK